MYRRCSPLLLLIFFALAIPAFAKPTEGTLGFDLYRGYLIVARGSAGPVKGLNFLLDTGANPTILDTRLADKLHLERSPARISVVGGSVAADRAVVASLVLGPVERVDFSVLVEDLSFFQKALPVRIDGVIGLDTLGQSDFMIDYVAHQVHFGANPVMPFSVPLQIAGGLAVVEAEVNDVPAHLLMDTGASSLTLFARNTGSVKDVRISQPIGEFARKEVTLHSLKLGGAEFGHEPASVALSPSQAYAFDGLVSPAVLGMRRVAFDLQRGVLEFSR